MELQVGSSNSLYEQVISGIKKEISMGILAAGDKLPSARMLASRLLINPNTVSKAYRQLEQENIIYTVTGKGTFVRETTSKSALRNEQRVQHLKQQLLETLIDLQFEQVQPAAIENWIETCTALKGGITDESRNQKENH